MRLADAVCFNLARYRISTRKAGDAGENPWSFDIDSYIEWRTADLRRQLRTFRTDLTGLDVLDFGCGGGALTALVAQLGVKDIIGIDVEPKSIEIARARLERLRLPVQPQFVLASNASTIDLPNASVDVILCFDTVEHILEYEKIMREWRRVLRANGRVFIWWCPWCHPYGHHVESLIPLPWAHVVFPEHVLTATCARIYDLPEFRPRAWDLDEAGRKKPNKWHALNQLPELNRLTISKFERICRQVGLRIEERQTVGFGGSALSRLTRVFTRIPVLREFFTSCVICELRPAAALSPVRRRMVH